MQGAKLVETRLLTPFGDVELQRYDHAQSRLRAWDAADEYLLHRLHETASDNQGTTLLVNDAFGAVGLSLPKDQIISIIDSAHHRRACLANLHLNKLDSEHITIANSVNFDPNHLPKPDRVIVKLPKSNAQLTAQLQRLRPLLTENTQILGAGMAKKIQASTLATFAKILGPATCSLARKKARLIDVQFDPNLSPKDEAWRTLRLAPSESGCSEPIVLESLAGTFAHGKLDLGTRLLLRHLPKRLGPRILDYGCGNGILGIAAGLNSQSAHISFVDDAAAAIASAKRNTRQILAEHPSCTAEFFYDDALNQIETESQDDVLNNPPFHDSGARTPYVALQMFREAKRVLKPGGRLWVVGNRHLNYHAKLKSQFGRCEQIGTHPKFVILKATKDETSR